MLVQEIFKPEYKEYKEFYGLEINEESSDVKFSRPPENFTTLGFVFKMAEDNLIDVNLLDLIISYNLTNINILIEVPSQILKEKLITSKNLLQLASNVDFSISLLPPGHPLVMDKVTPDEYNHIIKDFQEEMLKKQNFEKNVVPISNFIEYLMLEKLLGKEAKAIQNFIPTNEYIKNNFLAYMTKEQSDSFKDIIRNSFYDFYEGEENFNLIANVIFNSIAQKSKNVLSQHIQQQL